MSSSDLRSVNPLLAIDERNDVHQSIAKAKAEQSDIRQSIAKTEAELQSLLLRRNKVTNNILQLKKTLVIHRILPTEIIGYIFSILRAETVSVPYNQNTTPPQITVSHVCSRWREIALATPALWNDVEITKPDYNEWVQVARELLFNRSGTRRVNLALDMTQLRSDEVEGIFYHTVLPLHVKKLHLTLCLFALEKLSQKADDIIANVDEIAVSFTSKFNPMASIANEVSITPQLLSKIRSLTVLQRGDQPSLEHYLDLANLPWAQMRHLCCNVTLTLFTISDILRQCPLIDVCGIQIELDSDEVEPITVLTLPQLRIFHIFIYHVGPRCDQDRALRSFKCPNLTDFRLEIPYWTAETYKIIENHYNLHQLLRFETFGYPYPVSKVLFDAPMLQELILKEKFFMDERALQGVASGELGRCLTSLWFEGNFNEKKVLDTVASRQRHVKQVVEASRSWQDQQISGIKWIFLSNDDVKSDAKDKELEDELTKLGVIVYYRATEPLNLHPLSSLALNTKYY